MQLLLALFSQRTLLGDGRQDSLLEQLYNGRLEHMVPSSPGRIRLVQQVMPHNQDQLEIPFYRLEDALKRDPHTTLLEFLEGPHVKNDRLVFTHSSGSGEQDWVVEVTKSGVLQSSEYVEYQGNTSPVTLWGECLLKRINRLLEQAATFYTALHSFFPTLDREDFDAVWYLDGIADAICKVPREWYDPHHQSIIIELMAPKTIRESQMIRSGLKSLSQAPSPQRLLPLALSAMREILYPFSATEPRTGKTIRAIPRAQYDGAIYTAD